MLFLQSEDWLDLFGLAITNAKKPGWLQAIRFISKIFSLILHSSVLILFSILISTQ